MMSPKMDYDEWTPIGRGDPLKNDPTFDYSPPMVGKVKYWINPLHRTPDPPILPNREWASTESVGPYTATVTSFNKSSATLKQSMTNEIKRFYQDYKEASSDGASTSYLHTTNPKLSNKLHRLPPPPPQLPYQNHIYYNPTPTRQPPAPLPMLVPPPPVEPNSYSSSSRIENSTILELSWDNAKSHSTTGTGTAAESTTSSTVPRFWSTTVTPAAATKINVASSTTANELELLDTNSDKSLLQSLLGIEKSTDPPTTVVPLTPYPNVFASKHNALGSSNKSPTHLIIQGHSKVKKYGGFGKLRQEKSSGTSTILDAADIDDIDDTIKYELPKEARAGRVLGLEDFLPINGALKETLKDIATNQAEGSGFGAELTKVLFPSYVRPSTTLVYESPRYRHKLIVDSHSRLNAVS